MNKQASSFLLISLRQVVPFCLVILFFSFRSYSQEYFQQEVNYEIHVSLDDRQHKLNADITIQYINNSPDILDLLYFHLWPNGYSDNNTRLAKQLFESEGRMRLFNDPELKGYIDSLYFMVNGLPVQWETEPGLPDICLISLNEPLMPGDTLLISTPFRVKIPKGTTSRLGHIGQSYQITQWYPKPAVYDLSGWHPMPYLNQGEFYSEFGSFDVHITLPSNYVVGASGMLMNDEEVQWLDGLAKEAAWKKTMYGGGTSIPPSSEETKTLHFSGKNKHDFAWFADKRFHVMKGQVFLPGSGREITTRVMFTNLQARLWQHALEYTNNAIWYFSLWIGDYPYDNFTVVQSALSAGLGMEYPGITVIGHVTDAWSLEEVIAHEIAHVWFYGALASNERRYPFMDEGPATSYTSRYMNEMYPDKKLWELIFNNRRQAEFLNIDQIPLQRIYELDWHMRSRQNLDQPVDLSSTEYSPENYGHIIYQTAAMGFDYLRAWLGDSLFDSAMKDYYNAWKFRHPQPEDLRSVLEESSGMESGWFFDDFIGTTKRLDYKLVRLKNNRLLVKNNAELASPLVITGIEGDSVVFEKWTDGFHGQKWIDVPAGGYSRLVIDHRRVTPEINRLNNTMRTSGIMPGLAPVRPVFFFAIEDPGKHTLVYLPLVNWNRLNGFTPGIALYNGFILPKPVEYFLMPLYSVKNNSLIGSGQISFNITPFERAIRLVTFSFEGSRFGVPGDRHYNMVRGGIGLFFRPATPTSRLSQKITADFIRASDLYPILQLEQLVMSNFFLAGYSLQNTRLINPYTLFTGFEAHRKYQKASAGINYRYSYYGSNRGLDISLYAATMLGNESEVPFHALAPGGRSGRENYLYQGVYLDRFRMYTENFWSRQMTLSEGGMVSPVNQIFGYSQRLASLSVTSSLPGRAGIIPVKPFATLLLNDAIEETGNSRYFYEAGLKAGIWDVFEIYFPFLVSSNIRSAGLSFDDRIRFVFSIGLLDR